MELVSHISPHGEGRGWRVAGADRAQTYSRICRGEKNVQSRHLFPQRLPENHFHPNPHFPRSEGFESWFSLCVVMSGLSGVNKSWLSEQSSKGFTDYHSTDEINCTVFTPPEPQAFWICSPSAIRTYTHGDICRISPDYENMTRE